MKNSFRLMSLLFFLSTCCFAYGDKKKDNPPEIFKIYPKEETTKNRKRMPRRDCIESYYQNGVITIEFEIPEGDALFTVTDVVTGDNASTTFNTAMEFNYFIGSESSTYLLEISTSAGNDYEGYLTID